ncbi:hypothetical protein BaRGS_00005349 [Batillaria attramentaria]|uniref:Uncharacterized protein n=1 Tax=Batillaria attramentaria TaxID=370345 RepID=A0ABD0LW45_9CAEN
MNFLCGIYSILFSGPQLQLGHVFRCLDTSPYHWPCVKTRKQAHEMSAASDSTPQNPRMNNAEFLLRLPPPHPTTSCTPSLLTNQTHITLSCPFLTTSPLPSIHPSTRSRACRQQPSPRPLSDQVSQLIPSHVIWAENI